MSVDSIINEFLHSGVQTPWVAGIGAGVAVVAVGGVVAARKRGELIGRRRAREQAGHAAGAPTPKEKGAERILFICSLIPMLGVIAATMGVSFIGLQAFAEHDMGLQEAALLVPLTLDGISISFAFSAFVSAKRGRDNAKAERIVAASAVLSAVLNFAHGFSTWTFFAGLYLGFLSMMSLYMFRELLAQFTLNQQPAKKIENLTGAPAFGKRWVYAPLSTGRAHYAWIVFPPEADLTPTVRHALQHAERVREDARARKLAGKAGKKIDKLVVRDAVERRAAQLAAGTPIPTVPFQGAGPSRTGTSETVPAAGTPTPTVPFQGAGPSRTGTSETVPAAGTPTPTVPSREVEPSRTGTSETVPAAGTPTPTVPFEYRPSPGPRPAAPRNGTRRPVAAQPSRTGTVNETIPPALSEALTADTEEQLLVGADTNVASFSQRQVMKDRSELLKIAGLFPVDEWAEVWGVGQNELYRQTGIRKPRLKQLLQGDPAAGVKPLCGVYFPDGPNAALRGDQDEDRQPENQRELVAA